MKIKTGNNLLNILIEPVYGTLEPKDVEYHDSYDAENSGSNLVTAIIKWNGKPFFHQFFFIIIILEFTWKHLWNKWMIVSEEKKE